MAKRLADEQDFGASPNAAKNLGRDFSRYRKGEYPPSDTRLYLLSKCSPQVPGLLAWMIIARAIDRMIQRASREFGDDHTLDLIKFFRLSFHHFRHLLQRLDVELPKDDGGAWLYLQSQTYTGNTPFEADWYYPLTEEYMGLLAPRISAELQQADKCGRLAFVPTSSADFQKGNFDSVGWKPLPDLIHEAVRQRDFTTAISASQSIFTSRSRDAAEAAGLGDLFSHLALSAYDPSTAHHPLAPSGSDGPGLLKEAARLFALAFHQASGVQKTQHGISYLRFLLTPHRPKASAERPLAWKLHRAAASYYRRSGKEGSSSYLLGCLYWLEGKEKEAMREFMKAVKQGRASFAECDWIHLLRYAPELARRTSNKRALIKFLKISELEGVLYGESSPRTNLLEKEQRQHANAQTFRFTFKPFPDRGSPASG